jgi:hypothetical protein
MMRPPVDTLRSRSIGALTLAMAFSRALEGRRPRRKKAAPRKPPAGQIPLALEAPHAVR